jgi:hypothetical protein
MRKRLKKKLACERCLKCGEKTNLLGVFNRDKKLPKNYKKFKFSYILCKKCDASVIALDKSLQFLS